MPQRDEYSYYLSVKTPNYTIRDLSKYLFNEKKFNIDYISFFRLKESNLKSTDRVKVIQRFCHTYYLRFLAHVIDDVIENDTIFEWCDKNTWLEAIHRTDAKGKSWGTLSIDYNFKGLLNKIKTDRYIRAKPKTVIMLNRKRWLRLQEKKHQYRQFDERKNIIGDLVKDRQEQLQKERINALKLQNSNSKT
jgi:hypothetical protein